MDTPDSAWSNLLILISLSLVCLASLSLGGEEKPSPDSPSVFIIAEPNVVKGFPVIVKVRARGPQAVPALDFYGEVANINVVLVSTATKDKYTIRSYQIADDDWGTPEEGFVSDGSHQFKVELQENEERTTLFDLATLRPGIRAGTILYDVPPGKYDLSIQFRLSGVKSNSIPVEILSPSDDEEQFLERIGKLVANDFLKNGSGVSWSRFLRVGQEISTDDWNKLSELAQRQCQFHALLSKVLAPESPVKDIRIEPLRSMPVPEYLEPEKEFLFIEMEKAPGKDIAEKASALLQKAPGLRWRLDEINTYGMNLLGPRQYLQWRRKTRRPVRSNTAPAPE
jgi:hypothetical protein